MANVKLLNYVSCYLNRSLRFICSPKTEYNGCQIRRGISRQCSAVIYDVNGDPCKVLQPTNSTLPDVGRTDVAVRMLAAPINPADINMIQGVYPVRPPLPAIGGNEGVGEVIEVGSEVSSLHPGDFVIPSFSGWGTWRTTAVCPADNFVKIPNDLPLPSTATLSVNPCTAYRMLKDFEELSSGDVVIQNASNSGVGQAVIQIAAELNLRTVNIVRNRPDLDALIKTLTNLGATHVVTDEFLRTSDMKNMMKDLPKPKLGLNSVGGKSVAELLKFLAPKGTLVTYGGMSKQPLMVPTGSLIFNDAKVRGYWMTQWNKDNRGSPEMKEMWEFLASMIRNKRLQPPLHKLVPFEHFMEAIERAMQPLISEKQILVMGGKV